MTNAYKLALSLSALFVTVFVGCNEQVTMPKPAKLTRDAIGHYCNMIVVDHPGPKAQIREKDRSKPLWFSSVRDGLAYLALPGEAQSPVAVYVHDMGRANSWERPQHDGIWIKASDAVYVIGSSRRGGMGVQEAVPFKDSDRARGFVAQYGGRLVTYDEIPSSYVLGDHHDHEAAIAQEHSHSGHGG